MKLRLGFLASHGGSNVQAILDACREGRLDAEPCVVISNNSKAPVLDRARVAGIPTYHLSSETHPDPMVLDDEILGILTKHQVDRVILAGYMKKLGPKTLGRYRGRVLNIHPALLPKFGGKGMYGERVHEEVIRAGDLVSGPTVHFADEEYDRGKNVRQYLAPVLRIHTGAGETIVGDSDMVNDTRDSLASRVLSLEHKIFVDVLRETIEEAKMSDLGKILTILEQGQFEQFKGMTESTDVEFKGSPYRLDELREQLELAKDVAGMAQAGGGLILIGLKSVPRAASQEEEAAEAAPFAQELLNEKQYVDLIWNRVYPRPEGLVVRWFQSIGDSSRGIGVIIIPKQSDDLRPFLVAGVLDKNDRLREITFNLVRRVGSHNRPNSIQEIHSLIRDGARNNEILRRLEQVALELSSSGIQSSETSERTGINDRILKTVGDAKLDHGAFYLAAATESAVEMVGIYSDTSELVRILSAPPKLRAHGFDLEVGSATRIVAGQGRSAATETWCALNCWEDGVLVLAVDPWSALWPPTATTRINPLALCERTYLFAELCRLAFQFCRPPATGYSFLLGLIADPNKPDQRFELAPGPIPDFFSHFPKKATEAGFSIRHIHRKPQFDAGILGYLLVKHLYNWFGLPDEAVPYATKNTDGSIALDPELLRIAGERRSF